MNFQFNVNTKIYYSIKFMAKILIIFTQSYNLSPIKNNTNLELLIQIRISTKYKISI